MNVPAQPPTAATGRIDLTMMYAVHDAFRRDLALLLSSADSTDPADRAAFAAGWARFRDYLVIHHVAEDDSLWPPMRRRLADQPAGTALLDTMEVEHGLIDPLIAEIDDAVASGGFGRLRDPVEKLSRSLLDHLDHEEAEALPLLQRVLTPAEWKAFGDTQRRRVGISGAATFIPWLLDGAPETTQRKVLGLMPPPVRLLYRLVWRRRYERASAWRIPRE